MPKHSKKKRPSHKKTSSNSQKWKNFLNYPSSRKMLQQSWHTSHPQKTFSQQIRRLHRQFSSNKKR